MKAVYDTLDVAEDGVREGLHRADALLDSKRPDSYASVITMPNEVLLNVRISQF
jgi:hypothetical protein